VREHRGIYTLDAPQQSRPVELDVERLTDGVWTVSDGRYRALFAEGQRGVIALNTFGTPAAARAYRAAIEATVPGKPVSTLICTTDHLDHAGYGLDLAPDAEVVAHELTARVITGRGADGQSPVTRVVRGGGETLTLDGVELRLLYPGPTQGTGNLAVELPGRRLVFMVGLQAGARYGMFPDFHFEQIARSMGRVLELDFNVLVPGRYSLIDRAQAKRALDYIERLKESAQRAFANGVPIWELAAMTEWASRELAEEFGDLDGFDRHVGIGALRAVHHYLTGGWGLEDTAHPDLLLEHT
jgi:glyoxylase-like metal-dependent hydrolase (beta-lactamase superfamily II)